MLVLFVRGPCTALRASRVSALVVLWGFSRRVLPWYLRDVGTGQCQLREEGGGGERGQWQWKRCRISGSWR
eukprot:15463708-Alexandrium_andersonii.AAC.1